MADKKLNVKISTTGAGKAKKQVGGLNGAISKMGKAVGIASAAYFGARGLISGFSTVIRLAGIQEQAEKKLEVALGKTSKALLNQATALQKMTTFGDEAIIGVQSSLAAFIKDEEQIKKATEATLDMAVAMGMDLKAAGDLVAKTLGSSTNAMSRYGIEVKGAVGSTERLESLTNNVATLFGGQASAQAETMTGQIEQMKNSMGDAAETLGEVFGPAIIGSADLIKGAAESLKDFIAVSGDTIMSLFGIEKKTEESATATRDFSGEQKKLADELKATNAQLLEQKSISEDLRTFYTSRAEGLSQEINALKLRKLELDGTIEAMIEVVKRGGEVTASEMEQINTLIQLRQEVKNLSEGRENADRITAASFEVFELAQFDKLIAMEHEKDLVDEFILKYPEMAEALEMESQKNKNVMMESIKLAGLLSGALQTTFDPDLGAGEAFKGFVLQLMSAMQGVILASKAVSETLTFTFTGPLGIGAAIAALIALEAAKAGVRSIQFAETGFDGIVNQPTMFMTGEAGAERVSVTPLQGPNINGPQGGITLNISAPLIDEHILDTIIPAIQRAQRMNLA